MRLFESLLIALSTYSAVPVPQFDWNEKNMRYAICFFPAVGVLCGAALWLWAVLAQATGMSGVLFAAIAACLPILVTGGIHMDGYLDTVDALSSHQTREKKLAIMKDANCGAFAVIYGGVYLLAYAGFAYEVFAAGHILLICPLFVLSRALSGLCAVNLPNARKSGMLCAFTSGVQRRTATAALALVGLGLALCGLASFIPLRLLGLLLIFATLADITPGFREIIASLAFVELPPAIDASNNVLSHGMSNSLLFFGSADL